MPVKKKPIGKEHLKRIVEGIRRDFNERLDRLELAVEAWDDNRTPGRQAIMLDGGEAGPVEVWLKATMGFTTYLDFTAWLDKVGPKVVEDRCYYQSFTKMKIQKIMSLARTTLNEIPLVTNNGQ